MIILTVMTLDGRPPDVEMRGKFGVLGGTIGALEGNTIVLEDPQERMAELEANVIAGPNGFIIRNCGPNPLYVNATPVATSAEAPLDPGAEVTIGPFMLRVQAVAAPAAKKPAAAAPGATAPQAAIATATPAVAGAPIAAVASATPAASAAQVDPVAAQVTSPAPAPAPAAEPVPEASPAPPTGVSHEELQRALVAGLRIDKLDIPGGLTPEFMESIGQLLRQVTQGTIELLRIRAEAKSRVHADLTMIGSREINPLKAAWDAEVALQHLLAPQRADMLDPQRAMRDACDDLRLHDRGLVAGIHAALTGLLARFDPAALEQRLGGNSRFESMMPGGAKARRWDSLVELYGDISVEAEQDFWSLFDKEFLKAYSKGLDPAPDGGKLLDRV